MAHIYCWTLNLAAKKNKNKKIIGDNLATTYRRNGSKKKKKEKQEKEKGESSGLKKIFPN